MKPGQRHATRSTRIRKERRHPENANCRRFVDAWGDPSEHRGESSPAPTSVTSWQRLRRLSSTRAGRIIMLAPIGALGAYLLLRRRR